MQPMNMNTEYSPNEALAIRIPNEHTNHITIVDNNQVQSSQFAVQKLWNGRYYVGKMTRMKMIWSHLIRRCLSIFHDFFDSRNEFTELTNLQK